MVIQIIDIQGVAVFEPKGYSPIARDGHRMVSPHATLEGVKSETRKIHSLRIGRAVEGRQDAQEFLHVFLSYLR